MDDSFSQSGDGEKSSGKVRGGARNSLVERAAQKMASTGHPRKAPSAKEAPAPEPSVPGSLKGAPNEDASVVEAPCAPEELLAAALPETAPEEPRRTEELQGGGAARNPRQSRKVTIDLAALEARNILTPRTKRNRTLEEFRLIKRMVLSRRWDAGDAPGNTVLVTSALPSEGKTTTAINLAMSIAAEEDLRVLLVDADFIKPDALRQLGVNSQKGLIDVIQDPSLDIADVMLRTDIDKLSLIPSGQLHDRCTELLASARMDDLISEMANRYEDRILIFDSPPLLATTESVALASHMGQIVFVVESGRTKRDSVRSALELLGDRPDLGLVLNRTTSGFGRTEFGSYYGSYYYGYGHQETAPAAKRRG